MNAEWMQSTSVWQQFFSPSFRRKRKGLHFRAFCRAECIALCALTYMVTNCVNYESRESRASCVTAPGIINEKLHLTTNHVCFLQSTASVSFSFSGYLELFRSFDNLCYIPHYCLVSPSDSPSWPTSPWRTRPSRFTTSQLRWTPSPTLILWRAQGLMVVMNMLH